MNMHDTRQLNLLKLNVALALALLGCATTVHAACVDNGDGTFTCSGTSDNIDNPTSMAGTVTLDNASGAVVLNNTTTDPDVLGSKTTITNSAMTVGASSTLVTNGGNDVVINNTGSVIEMNGSARVFNPAGWSNDAAGHLYNDGVAVGMAAAINATSGLNSLTINNLYVNDGLFHPSTFEDGVHSLISNYGDYTAAIYTNTPLLTINNSSFIGTVFSFGGATYTPPAVLDGTQYAAVSNAGTTVVNISGNGTGYIDSLYVVDRNPLLMQAQAADGSLALAYGAADVGPRNSVINVGYGASGIGNLYLGSGAHVVNVGDGFSGSNSIRNITVDQHDAEVVDVSGGVATTLYKVHGDRTFTYNSINQFGPGNITIHDVAGAVNAINATGIVGTVYSTIQADGLGDNSLSMGCGAPPLAYSPDLARCAYQMTASGMSTINFSGEPTNLFGSFSASGDINVLASRMYFYSSGSLTAANVVVGAGANLDAGGVDLNTSSVNRMTGHNQVMGSITGNLVNYGGIYLGDATLNVSGDSTMHTGSTLGVGIGLSRVGLLDTGGVASFASDSTVTVNIKQGASVRDGESHVIANHASGLPSIQNNGGLVQWSLANAGGDLILNADVGVPDTLAASVTPAARNATKEFFGYSGTNRPAVKLMAELETFGGRDIVRAVERLRPEINDGALRMVLGNTDKLFNIIDARMLDHYLSAAGANPGNAGLASGDEIPQGKGIWVQGIGDRGSQKALDGIDGYGLSSVGMAAGMDRTLDADGDQRVGIAFGYARGNIVDAGNTVNNRVDTSSYMAMAYASRAWDDWYVNGAMGFGRHVYDTHRQLLDMTAIGHHDSWQFAARIDAGMPMAYNESLTFVPMVSLDYSHLKESGYRENGVAPGALMVATGNPQYPYAPVIINGVPQFELVSSPINLAISGRSFDSYRAGLGGKAIYSLQEPGWAAEVELHGMLRHEFGDLALDSTARFVIGGDSFSSPGVRPVRNDIILGGAIRMTGDDENDQLTLLTSYDANIREKYFGQTVALNLRYDFDQAPRYLRQAAARQSVVSSAKTSGVSVTATEADIANIHQAMQPRQDNDPENMAISAVGQAISNWLNALSNKDVDSYFNSYAANFVVPDGSTRQQWERWRKSEITRSPNLAVKTSYLTIKPEGNQATAMFTQTASQGESREMVQKVVDLENRGGRWLIVREESIALSE